MIDFFAIFIISITTKRNIVKKLSYKFSFLSLQCITLLKTIILLLSLPAHHCFILKRMLLSHRSHRRFYGDYSRYFLSIIGFTSRSDRVEKDRGGVNLRLQMDTCARLFAAFGGQPAYCSRAREARSVRILEGCASRPPSLNQLDRY